MGKTAAIICNGLFPKKEYPRYLVASADYIICCDGGTSAYLKASPKIFGQTREPDVIIGDLDSIQPKLKKQFAEKIVHVSEQDNNDMTKAFTYVLDHLPDVDTVHFIAATGLREDHTIGNVSLLMEYMRRFDLSQMNVDMVSDFSTIFAVSDSISLEVGIGRRVSIFSPDNSLKIKSKGLVWPTDDVVFDNWWKATLNKAAEDTISLEFNHPSMVLLMMD